MKWRSLTRNSEFQKVYREGAKYVGRLLVVYLLPGDNNARGTVASRKVGGAVQRNRAKRLLREALNNGLPSKESWPGAVLRERFPEEFLTASKANSSNNSGFSTELSEKAGLWVVVVARRNILSSKSQEVQEELDRFLGKAAGNFLSQTTRS